MNDVFELDEAAELDLRESLDDLAEKQGAELWQIGTGYTIRSPGMVQHYGLIEDAATALREATRKPPEPRKADEGMVIYMPHRKASLEPLKPVPSEFSHAIRQSWRGYRLDSPGITRHFAKLECAIHYLTKTY
jgi:hypothetical protein